VAEVTLDGQIHATPPIPFSMAGITMTLDVGKGPDGAATVNVRSGPPVRPGIATFDRTCTAPVVYKLFRNGEPMQLVELRKMFDKVHLDLSSAA
jgi:hypothetical protein